MSGINKLINKIFYRPKLYFIGMGNEFEYDTSAYFRRVKISIYGNNNNVIIGKNVYLHNTDIKIGFPNCKVNNCIVKIGDNSGVNSMNVQIGESDSIVSIGKDCMFSYNIEINCTDHHSIFDEDNNLLNKGQFVEIGNHVWICKDVLIQKNSKIPDGCVVGQRAVVAKQFEKQNCVIVGNPAKVVKEKIYWTKDRPNNV